MWFNICDITSKVGCEIVSKLGIYVSSIPQIKDYWIKSIHSPNPSPHEGNIKQINKVEKSYGC